jgi:hypothetical protein
MAKDTKKSKGRKKNDWLGFGKYLISALITTILFAFIGSNFIFIQQQVVKGEKKIIEKLFPYDTDKPPYWDDNDEKLKTRKRLLEIEVAERERRQRVLEQTGGSNSNQETQGLNMKTNRFLTRLGLNPNIYGFPYKGKAQKLESLKGDLYEWFSNSLEFSYSNGRRFLTYILDAIQEFPTIVILFISVLIIFPLILLLTPIYGMISTLIGIFNVPSRDGWFLKYLIAFLFIILLGVPLAGIVSTVQMLQVLATFIILPLINYRDVWTIVTDQTLLLTAMFGLLVLIESFIYLKPEAVGIMGITYVYLVWKSWKSRQSA